MFRRATHQITTDGIAIYANDSRAAEDDGKANLRARFCKPFRSQCGRFTRQGPAIVPACQITTEGIAIYANDSTAARTDGRSREDKSRSEILEAIPLTM
jgi:hypothetical protein